MATRINTTYYAKTLYKLTENQNQENVNKTLSSFAGILIKNRDAKYLPKIIEKFKKIWNQENNIVEAIVTSKEKLDENLINKIKEKISKKYNAQTVEMTNAIDPNIKGGIILRVGDEMTDNSLIKKLSILKKQLLS